MGHAVTADSESIHVLSLSSIVGGQTETNRLWVEAVRRISQDLSTRREGVASNINVNVEFHISGNLLSPDFVGLRTAGYRKTENSLRIQVALPAILPENAELQIFQYIRDAVDEVERWASARRRSVNVSGLQALIDGLASGL